MRAGKSTSVRNKLAIHFVGACSLTGSNTTHHFLSIIFYFILIVAFRAKYILASNGRTTRRRNF